MTETGTNTSPKALSGLRVLDLSRVLAGPYCTQILGDLGADIIKIEKPDKNGEQGGDDTRRWGPPFLQDSQGHDTTQSAYYLSCNRNKKSVTIDIAAKEGQSLIHRLLAQTDILVENFRTGTLAKYGLSYDHIKARYPRLIYCSITGYGQTGPLAHEPGYDFLAQAAAGLMAVTGEPDGAPMKAGVALSDIITGLNAAVGILAALRARDTTGAGQHIDLALTDCTLSAMTNLAQYYLTSGTVSPRYGNAHSTIVPYEAFKAQDEYIILAIGNDPQFQKFCHVAGHPEWGQDPRFSTNTARLAHRTLLTDLIKDTLSTRPAQAWITACEAENVPCGPILRMDAVFNTPQIQAREMDITMAHPLTTTPLHLVGSPLKLSATPVSYDRPPPLEGSDTTQVLKHLLGLTDEEISKLKAYHIIQGA